MKIKLNHEKLQYTGRIDDSDPQKPEFIFPASSLEFSFRGTGASVVIRNRRGFWNNYLGIIVDGKQRRELLPQDDTACIVLGEHLEDTAHRVMIFKRQDSCHEFVLEELELADGSELLDPPERPQRRIEVFGDSVSAGEVSEAVEYVGKPDPEHNGEYSNSWYSYSWITARKLGAQLHDTAQGGVALLDKSGWFCAPDYVGMETIWNKVHCNPVLNTMTEWDFKKYRPHVVIAAIGQNDSNPEDYMKKDLEGEKAGRWKAHYESWIRKLRDTYPAAEIILTTTILNHDPAWDEAIEQVCSRLDDPKVHHFLYSRNGRGTPGHIRISEAEQMADELCAFINSLPESIWQEQENGGEEHL